MADPKQLEQGESSGGHTGSHEVFAFYLCPRDECRSYYGASGMGPLEKIPNRKVNSPDITHMRNRCPYCGEDRVLRYARLVPASEQAEAEREAKKRVARSMGPLDGIVI